MVIDNKTYRIARQTVEQELLKHEDQDDVDDLLRTMNEQTIFQLAANIRRQSCSHSTKNGIASKGLRLS